MRIFHPVQHQQKDVFAAAVGKQIVDVGKHLARGERHHSLVRVGVGGTVDFLSRNKTHGDTLAAALVDNALHAGVCAVAADSHVVETAFT